MAEDETVSVPQAGEDGALQAPLPPGVHQRLLSGDDLPALHRLHDQVRAALPDPSLFNLFGGAESFFTTHFGERGISLGLFRGDALLAYGALTRPRAEDADNYAAALGWPVERTGAVALLSAAMVSPHERRRRLHGALIEARLRQAAQDGVAEVLARAAPANAVSRQSLMGRGFRLVWLGAHAGGLMRHVFLRPVQPPGPLGAGAPLRWISADDLAAQRAALNEGWVGVEVHPWDGALGFTPGP
jgi:hypothetical protein